MGGVCSEEEEQSLEVGFSDDSYFCNTTKSLWFAGRLKALGQRRKKVGKAITIIIIILEPESDNKQGCGEASTQESLHVVRKVITEGGAMISIEQLISAPGGRKQAAGSAEASSPLPEPSPYPNAMLTKKHELLCCLGGHV